jgi:hypothetical protein
LEDFDAWFQDETASGELHFVGSVQVEIKRVGRDLELGKGSGVGDAVLSHREFVVLEFFNHDIGVVHSERGLGRRDEDFKGGIGRELPNKRQRHTQSLITARR